MSTLHVLFVCVHNSARSQMAEAFLKQIGGDRFSVESAGIEPGTLNPIVVAAMKEVDIDISGNATKSVGKFMQQGSTFDFIVTVCDEASAERCPVFPGAATRLHWGFADPATFQGTGEEKLEQTRVVRDAIRKRVEEFCVEHRHVSRA